MPVIFVSRECEENSPLRELEKSGCTLICKPLIRITPIRFTHTPESDWVFFSSKNAIRHFFTQNPVLRENTKFGVLSENSAEFLAGFDRKADFTGSGADVKLIAQEFSKAIGDDTVLFPQALHSLQTVQQNISFSNTCFNLYVYKTTRITEFEDPQADILVFTSPSNAQAYFEQYRYRNQVVVAIGKTTMYRLKSYGVRHILLPETFSEKGLLDVLKPLCRESLAE